MICYIKDITIEKEYYMKIIDRFWEMVDGIINGLALIFDKSVIHVFFPVVRFVIFLFILGMIIYLIVWGGIGFRLWDFMDVANYFKGGF